MDATSREWRYRAGARNRIESFSDSVFGFSITLLVVSSSVPRTFGDLVDTMKGFAGFALCFWSLFAVWHQHRQFYRRYDLQDSTILWLNSILLFLVIFYVYPLKFLFSIFSQELAGIEVPETVIANTDVPLLMVIYGIGFAAVSLTLAVMYGHALRQRQTLALTPFEVLGTKQSIASGLINGLVALGSAAIAYAGRAGWAGWFYFSLWIFHSANGFWWGRQVKRLPAEIKAA